MALRPGGVSTYVKPVERFMPARKADTSNRVSQGDFPKHTQQTAGRGGIAY